MRRYAVTSNDVHWKRLERYREKCVPVYDTIVLGTAVASTAFVHKTVLFDRDPSLRQRALDALRRGGSEGSSGDDDN